MRFVVRLLFLASLAAASLVPAATAADRMWVGFHDDPDAPLGRDANGGDGQGTRQRAAVSPHDRRMVRRSRRSVPRQATDPFDPAYKFGDVDEFVRNAQQRGLEVLITIWGTPGWANGNQKPQAMPRNLADFQNFARAVASRYSGRFAGYPFVRFYTIWNESNLATFLVPAVQRGRARSSARANYAKLARAGIAGIKAGNRKRARRDRRDVVERPRQEAGRA